MLLPSPSATKAATNGRTDEFVGQALRLTAVVAGVFSLMVGLAMVLGYFRARPIDLLQPERLQAAKDQLRVAPGDESLKTQIRKLDLQLRLEYFRQLTLTNSGGWLVLAGASLFLLAIKKLSALDQKLPLPRPVSDDTDSTPRVSRLARWSVAAIGALVFLGLLVIPLTVGTSLPTRPGDLEKRVNPGSLTTPEVAEDFALPEEMERHWPRFRGASGNGVSSQTNILLNWDAKSGQGIAWKSVVPAPGFGSPIVWGNRVFLSGGDAAKRSVFCYDATAGNLAWERAVESPSPKPPAAPEIPEQTGYAASTPATDGRRVYAIFATGDLAAFTLEGNLVWVKNLGWPKNPYGHAASLATWRGRLLVQWDQGEREQRLSKLYAFDGRTGQIVWQQPRSVSSSWATPIVISAGGKEQVVTLSVPFAMAYSATDGSELWRVEEMNGEVTPSPVFAGGLVLAVSPSEKLMAIRPEGQGDVTKTHLAWTAEENVPDITSPVSNGELVFTLTTYGMLSCFDAKDGKKVWEHDFAIDCHASPSIVGTRLYVVGTKGDVVVTEVGRQFKELARTQMNDTFYASPAFGNGRMFLRGAKHLYCIGTAQAPVAKAENAR